MSPTCLAPISTIQYLVCSSQRRIVSGTPISVLKFPSVATVLPANCRIEARNSFVVVLPCEPVIPTNFSPVNLLLTYEVRSNKACPTSSTCIDGEFTCLETNANFAPDLIAESTKSWPST